MMLSRTVAIVTGGSSGLGAATASFLVRNGGRVIVADLGHQHDSFLKMAETLGVSVDTTEVTREGPGLAFAETDVTDASMVEAALDFAEQRFGEPVNAAISCAGIASARKTLSKKGAHPLDEFARTVMVNTVGSFNVSRLAAERMSRREPEGKDGLRGCIINTASIAAFEGQIGQVAYAASKGGVVGMTLPMARDLAPYGIRVMTLAPGLFLTPLLNGLPENVKAELGASVPCPSRLGDPDEFGQLVGSVLTNPMLNGTVIRLDGALRMSP